MRLFPETVTPDIVNLFISSASPTRLGTGPKYDLHEQYFREMCPSEEIRVTIVQHFLDFATKRPKGDTMATRIMYMSTQLQGCVKLPSSWTSDGSLCAQATVSAGACIQLPPGDAS